MENGHAGKRCLFRSLFRAQAALEVGWLTGMIIYDRF